MNPLRDYVDWKLTHPQGYMSRNLFDKDNLIIQNSYRTRDAKSTETGVSFYTTSDVVATTYAQIAIVVGNASDYRGKTITFSTPSYGGTSGTRIAVFKKTASIQNGSNSKKTGDLYYSVITVEDKEYTDEKLCIVLYAYGKGADEFVTYEKIMVNEGDEILQYEPYGKFIKK